MVWFSWYLGEFAILEDVMIRKLAVSIVFIFIIIFATACNKVVFDGSRTSNDKQL